ncbi:MAG: hypothetical protein ABEJ57_04390 [Halobacteriaceae archaeon]
MALLVLGVSLGKDLIDEVRMRRGGEPVAYATIEHTPSTIVLLALLLVGRVTFGPAIAGIDRQAITAAVGTVDLVLDISQDLRAG